MPPLMPADDDPLKCGADAPETGREPALLDNAPRRSGEAVRGAEFLPRDGAGGTPPMGSSSGLRVALDAPEAGEANGPWFAPPGACVSLRTSGVVRGAVNWELEEIPLLTTEEGTELFTYRPSAES